MEYVKLVVEPISVQEAVNEYIPSVQHLGSRTLEEYIYELAKFADWCGANNIMLHQVNNKTVYQFLAHVKATHKPVKKDADELSSYTLAGYVRVVKTFLSWCFEEEQFEGQVKSNTLKRIKKPKVEQTIIQTYTKEDIEAFFVACEKECSTMLKVRDKAIIAALIDTGIRASELVTLTLSNVYLDPKDSFICVLGKGEKWGEVGLGAKSRAYLKEYIETFRVPQIIQKIAAYRNLSGEQERRVKQQVMKNEPVFLNHRGDSMTRNGLNRMITRLGEWAGIEGVRCCTHDFRHTFAVNFIRQGGDVYTLSKLLRHSSIDVTEEYLKSLKQTDARRHAKSVLDNL